MGEFTIVVVGVVVALAADGWREDLIDRRSERDYLARLATDLEAGRNQLEQQERRFQRALNAATSLMESLEGPTIADSVLIDQFRRVASSGFNEFVLRHDATYREMTTTGRLMIIRDPDFRQQVVDYYFAVSRLIESMTNLPRNASNRFIQLAGYYPYVFSNGDVELSAPVQNRLLREIRENPELRRDVRELNARLAFVMPIFSSVKLQRDSLAHAIP